MPSSKLMSRSSDVITPSLTGCTLEPVAKLRAVLRAPLFRPRAVDCFTKDALSQRFAPSSPTLHSCSRLPRPSTGFCNMRPQTISCKRPSGSLYLETKEERTRAAWQNVYSFCMMWLGVWGSRFTENGGRRDPNHTSGECTF